MKKILITGANSYIGDSFDKYIKSNYSDYEISTIDMLSENWIEEDFSVYDSIFHVAGIAHSDNGKISEDKAKLYYSVNTELALKVATHAKNNGVKQFIYMSSAIVYGNSSPMGKIRIIDKNTQPTPANAYGDSKLQAEIKLLELDDNGFKVVIVRPPMIYGKNSKGNYPVLSKYAKKLPIFPNVKNTRSMLYIENLCEFIRLVIKNEEQGLFMPQNKEYVITSDLVKTIAINSGKSIKLTKIFNPILKLASPFVGVINKVFGSLAYDKSLSEYKEEYCLIDFKESIARTEKL